MSGDPKRQIQDLLELAVRSPHGDEEGRNAAMAVCRMIRQHALLIVRPDELVTFIVPSPARPESARSIRKREARATRERARPIGEIVESAAEEIAVRTVRDIFRGR